EGDGRRIDDPVRMYLTQMGSIPLLSRNEEISLAKKIEMTRKRFRRKVLECDYALCNVVETLRRVHTGDLPFDRTVKVSLTDNLENDKILHARPPTLPQTPGPADPKGTAPKAPPHPPPPPPKGRDARGGAVDPPAEGPA